MMPAVRILLAGCLLACLAAAAQTDIARTRHNLTATGPGTIRSTESTGLCIFCHTGHNANPSRGLWNRELPAVTYQPYSSSTMQAATGQPTGSSRLCLSCHDGILALGTLRVPAKGQAHALGPLTGPTAIGTDLSKSHPVSFIYDSALAAKQGELADPLALPRPVAVDRDRQLQCTSCHDPHDDRRPSFLNMETRSGALCTSCHRPRNWNGSAHATSQATLKGSGSTPWPAGAAGNVADHGCENCHRTHSAGHSQWLLAQPGESANCTVCHNGNVAGKDIQAEFQKPQHHPVEGDQWAHDPKENPLVMPRHVGCTDCHNPHATSGGPGSPTT